MENNVCATMSVEAAAKICGISRGLAYQLARENKLPVIRLGKRLLVSRAALTALLAGGTPQGGGAEGARSDGRS